MLLAEYKQKISDAEPNHDVLSRITFEALKDTDISIEDYDKLVEMCVKKEINAKM